MLSLNNGVFLKLCPESHPCDDVLQSMGSQRVGHNWVTKLNALLYFSWQIFKWRLFFFPFIFVLPSMLVEKAMAPHSSTLAWRAPQTEEPGGLQSMGLQRVGHDWATSLSLFTFMHWRRKWQLTPGFLPGGSQGWRNLVGCLWGHTESDTTEVT